MNLLSKFMSFNGHAMANLFKKFFDEKKLFAFILKLLRQILSPTTIVRISPLDHITHLNYTVRSIVYMTGKPQKSFNIKNCGAVTHYYLLKIFIYGDPYTQTVAKKWVMLSTPSRDRKRVNQFKSLGGFLRAQILYKEEKTQLPSE